MSAHRLHVYAKFGVYSSYGLRETLSGEDRHTDGRTNGRTNGHVQIEFSRSTDQEYIYFIGSHMSRSTYYIHST